MSEVRVNKLSPRSGTTVTLGDSGDTISIPSGVTLSTASFSSTGIDDNATSTAITINSNENVLIGGTSESALDGVSGIAVGSSTASSAGIAFQNSAHSYLIYSGASNDSLLFYDSANDVERMRIDSSGDIGIGTSNPTGKLNIATATSDGVNTLFGANVSPTAAGMYVGFNDSDATATLGVYYASSPIPVINITRSDRTIKFMNDASERMRIESSGNVGIGTTSPSEKLDVSGNINLTDSLLIDGAIKFEAVKSSSTGQDSIYKTATNTLAFNTAGTERMRIDSSGKVGINTTSPYGKFEVHSGGGGTNYAGSSAIKSGVTWGSEASSHTISIFNYNENDNSSGMLLVHAKADSQKCGTLMLLFTKKGGSGVSITTVSSKTDGMSTFSASTSGNNINISTDSDCAICWQSYYGV